MIKCYDIENKEGSICMKVYLDNFVLEEYDRKNLEHSRVIERLNQDKNSQKYLGDLFYAIQKNEKRKEESIAKLNRTFIPYYNEYPIGYFAIYNIDSEYQISCGILEEYRKQFLASLLIEEASEYFLSHYEDIDELFAIIDKENIASQRASSLVGYNRISEEKYSRKK